MKPQTQNAKHTPGPWDVTDLSKTLNPKGAQFVSLGFSDGAHVTGKNAPANARLIAEAPELLEVLKRALVCCETKSEPSARALVVDIRAAIAKAEGR